jgi:hypothetical protein
MTVMEGGSTCEVPLHRTSAAAVEAKSKVTHVAADDRLVDELAVPAVVDPRRRPATGQPYSRAKPRSRQPRGGLQPAPFRPQPPYAPSPKLRRSALGCRLWVLRRMSWPTLEPAPRRASEGYDTIMRVVHARFGCQNRPGGRSGARNESHRHHPPRFRKAFSRNDYPSVRLEVFRIDGQCKSAKSAVHLPLNYGAMGRSLRRACEHHGATVSAVLWLASHRTGVAQSHRV